MVVGININNNINSFANLKQKKPFAPQDTNQQKKNYQIQNFNITPDYNIKLPTNYTVLPTLTLENGQKIHQYKLSNGQKVLLAPMKVPTTYINTYVNTGAINETQENTGISHLLEHIVLNDKKNELSSQEQVKLMGGDMNGKTSLTQTYYTIAIPQFEDKDLENCIKMQASMVFNPTINDQILNKEKNIVKSEINMFDDNTNTTELPYLNKVINNLYSINTNTLGKSSDVDKITPEQLKEYHKTNYTPESSTTIITGDIQPEKTINLIAKYFNTSGKQHENKQTITPINKTIRKDIIGNQAKTKAIIAFDVPNNIQSKIGLKLIEKHIDENQKNFVDNPDNKSFTILSQNILANRNTPIAILNTSSKNPEEDLKQLFKNVNNYPPIDDKELNKYKEDLKVEFAEKLETPKTMQELLSENLNNLENLQNYNKIIDTQSPEVVSKASKQLDLGKASILVFHPTGTTLETIKNNYKNANHNINFGSLKKIYNQNNNIETFILNNNIEMGLYNKENSQNTIINMVFQPTTTIKHKEGVREVANTILENINPTPYDIRKNYTDIYIKPNNAIYLTTQAPTEKTQNLCDFIKNIKNISNELDTDCVEDAKANLKNNFTPATRSTEIEANNILNINEDSILQNLENITVDDVKKYFDDIFNTSSITVASTGETNKTKNVIINNFNQFNTVNVNTKQLSKMFTQSTSKEVTTQAINTKQADLATVYKYKINGNLKDETSIDLLTSIVSNRNFDNLREKSKLGYQPDTVNFFAGDCGILSFGILTDTDNKSNIQNAFTETQKIVNDLKRNPPTDKELVTAKNTLKLSILENSYKQKDITTSLLDGMLSPYGANKINQKLDIIDTISKQDIQNTANYIFQNSPHYIIRASEDALIDNKNFLGNLKQS